MPLVAFYLHILPISFISNHYVQARSKQICNGIILLVNVIKKFIKIISYQS